MHTHTRRLQIIGLDAEFFFVYDGSKVNGVKLSVGLLAIVSQNDDGTCTLFKNVVRPRLNGNEMIDIRRFFTGVTWRDWHPL